MALATIVEKVKEVFTSRAARIQELANVEATADAEERELKRTLDAAQQRVDELEEPHKALKRAKEAMYVHGLAVERKKAPARTWLQDNPTRELASFKALLDRLAAKIRTMDGPVVEETTDFYTSAKTITNRAELERWHVAVSGPPDPERPGQRLPSAVVLAQRACATELWRLDEAGQRVRIAELRRAIEESFRDTLLASELG